MEKRWSLVLVVVGVVVAAAVAIGIALAGGEGSSSQVDYQADVVVARDRVDYALERITKSQSADELVNRIEDAAQTVDNVGNDLGGVNPAKGFEDEHKKLVRTLHTFAAELTGTAETLRDPTFAGTLSGINSLSFEQWNAVNRILEGLKEQGIEVEPLARH